jgi:phosphoadenosine phosphosulfate reductase
LAWKDQLITDLIATHDLDVEIATLDTGRLFEETHAVWAATEQRYGRRIRAFYPRQRDLEALIAKQGSNGFYDSKDARLACCHVRKVEPLERALSDTQAWITGLRAEQSAYRKDMALVSADRTRGLVKLNPLFDLTRDQVLELIAKRAIPINGLHAKGYASIGCPRTLKQRPPGSLRTRLPRRLWRSLPRTQPKRPANLQKRSQPRTQPRGPARQMMAVLMALLPQERLMTRKRTGYNCSPFDK